MNTLAPECPRCHARMARGFIVDETHSSRVVARWAPGEPRKSMWTGLKIDKNDLLPVATFRCAKCGYLESYADRGFAGG